MFAYLLLVDKNPRQVARLVARLRNRQAHVFIHVDAKANAADFVAALTGALGDLRGVTFIPDRVKVMWGGFSMVQATLNLLRAALAADRYRKFLLLSGSCYPATDIGSIQERLAAVDGEIIEVERKLSFGGKGEYDQRISRYHLTDHEFLERRGSTFGTDNDALRPICDNLNVLCGSLRGYIGDFLASIPFAATLPESGVFHGSQWWCLSDECVHDIVRHLAEHPAFVGFFRYTSIPDEMFFQSAVMATKFRRRITGAFMGGPVLHLIDWKRPNKDGQLPRTMTLEDHARIRESGALFVRKIHESLSQELLDRLDRDAQAAEGPALRAASA